MKELFGNIPPELPRFLRHPFMTNNVERCEKFKNKVRELYDKSNIFEIVEKLDKRFKNASGCDLDEVIKDCIKYGEVASQLLLGAGRKIGNNAYKQGKPYSDQLSLAAKSFHKKRNELRFLKVQQYSSMSKQQEADIIIEIKKAYQDLRLAQRDAVKLQEDFLKTLVKKRATEWNLSTDAALNTII
jgi:hypothetical protein